MRDAIRAGDHDCHEPALLVIGAAAIGSFSLLRRANAQPAGGPRADDQTQAQALIADCPSSEIGITNMSTALRIFYRIPLIGWLVNDAIHGAPDAKYYFAANLALSFVLLLYAFGYAFLISVALAATALGFVSLFALTSAGLFGTRLGKTRTQSATASVNAAAGKEEDSEAVGKKNHDA